MEITLRAIRQEGLQGIQFVCISPRNDFAIGLKKEQEKYPKLCVFSLKKDYSINSEILIEEFTRGITNGFNIEAIFHPYFDPPIFAINGSPYGAQVPLTNIYQLNQEKTGVIHLDTTYAYPTCGKILFHQTLPIMSIHRESFSQICILKLNDENKLTDLYCKFKRGCYRGFSTITFHPSEPVIVTGSEDGDHLIKIWRFNEDYTKTECIEILQHPISPNNTNHYRILQIIFHPKSEIMATIGNKIIKIWRINCGSKPECLYTKITDDDEIIENCVFHPTKPIIVVKCRSSGPSYKYFTNIYSISPIGELTNIGVIQKKFSSIKFNDDGNCLIVDEYFEKAQEGYQKRKTITEFISTSFYDFSKIMPIVVEKPKVVKEDAKKVPPPDYLIDSAFSCEIMEDPVISSDGITYNRREIEKWFKKHDTSPKTGEILKSKNLIPNISIRNAIEEWKKSNPQ